MGYMIYRFTSKMEKNKNRRKSIIMKIKNNIWAESERSRENLDLTFWRIYQRNLRICTIKGFWTWTAIFYWNAYCIKTEQFLKFLLTKTFNWSQYDHQKFLNNHQLISETFGKFRKVYEIASAIWNVSALPNCLYKAKRFID